ncbi:MAG TPA: response regulator [Pirellulales bacterium]|jgi:CheY-like chemotaxis protein|nr:response regulator [Pirellulales bacterium]
MNVLVVEDVPNVALTFAGLIRAYGHRAQVVFSAEQALQIAREFRPQTVFIDIGLPEMDGYELARRLRGIDELAGSILISVSGSAGDPERFRQSGLNHHLTKPVALDALIGILDQKAKVDFAR